MEVSRATGPTAWPARVIRALQALRRFPLIPTGILGLLVASAAFAPLIAPHHPLEGDTAERNTPPAWVAGGSGNHLLGTDYIGRDIFSRIVFGARVSMLVALTVPAVGAFVGTAVGAAAGYFGGFIDETLMRFTDFTYGVPFIMVAILIAVVFGSSLFLVIVLLAAFGWPPFARQVRAETLVLKHMDYVQSARISGASSWRVIYRHLLPGLTNTIVVLITLRVGSVILAESVLSFLGVGIPAPQPTWGSIVADGRIYLTSAWWISFFPGVAIFLTVMAFNFAGDWLRDRLDPRLRQI